MNTNFFKLAKNVSKLSDYKIKIGAVLVKGGSVISVGFNKFRYDKEFSSPPKDTLHAEMACIKYSNRDIDGSVIYVYRENSKGIALSKPCHNCMDKLKKFGVKKVYYTINEFPYFEEIKL